MISLLAAAATCLFSLSPFMLSLLAAAAGMFLKLVALHDFALGRRCLSLLAAAAALSPKLVSLHDFTLGWLCRLVSQACLPSCFCSWQWLPSCLPSLSLFMISLLAAAAVLSPKLVFRHDFAFGCRCCLVCEAWLPS